MILFMGADHAGYPLKEFLKSHLAQQGYEIVDVGVHSEQPADYPDIAHTLTEKLVCAQRPALGILICGTGIGMSIAANKRRGIRAANASEPVSAALAREHNNANIICLGARVVGPELARATVEAFLRTGFSPEDRHHRRVEKLELLGGETTSHTD
ncbi:MAG: ribose 5-phosphate isomerase B [Fimbriimonadales bacterium]|nr:MAG: ribose 5-phosphate isomerase B [Fimbriimonadales bacterium]GIV08757.1 MAG: ribose 5-phosphate isomerase B [Fimbriimonadales bacterium]